MPPLQAKHPIVLLHGAAGFVRLPGIGVEYFRGVQSLMRDEGNTVLAWKVPNFGITVEGRARALLRHLRGEQTQGPYNLVAHSMGGLDARHLISRLGGADLVASLTTIGTPHHGTSVAEIRNSVLRGTGVLPLAERHGHRFADEMQTFTLDWSRRFNEETPDAPGIRYRAWAGEVAAWRACPLFQPLMPLIRRREGPSDGLISVKSARWCDAHFAGIIEADHFAQLGWKLGLNRLDSFDHREFYRRILREIVEAGL